MLSDILSQPVPNAHAQPKAAGLFHAATTVWPVFTEEHPHFCNLAILALDRNGFESRVVTEISITYKTIRHDLSLLLIDSRTNRVAPAPFEPRVITAHHMH
jgi:hypothetical protein